MPIKPIVRSEQRTIINAIIPPFVFFWGYCTLVVLPVVLIVLVVAGFVALALPVLVIVGIVALGMGVFSRR